MFKKTNSALLLIVLVALSACNKTGVDTSTHDFEKDLIEKLILAKTGDVIDIPAGRHEISRGLSLKVDGVTIKGVGMDKSILSFRNQIQGAEGLIITANDISLVDFAVEDTKGDAIKINECTNLLIKNVRVEWTNGPNESNGAYGLYPVQCKNVLIDGSVAIGASDAGIYVGQSDQVIVKNSRAEFNVAGIEIENTTNADVFDNIATNNTGGILVFNMPNLPQPGSKTRVFHNQIFENNTRNFAPKGTAVAGVPAGSGVVVNSNDLVEIFDNDIKDNATANIIISSYFATGYSDRATSESFDPYPESIYIYNNRFSGGGDSPDGLEFEALKRTMFGLNGRLPDILWDGYQNESLFVEGKMPDEFSICIANGDAVLLNVDFPHESKNVSVDMSSHQCTLEKLPEIKLSLFNNI